MASKKPKHHYWVLITSVFIIASAFYVLNYGHFFEKKLKAGKKALKQQTPVLDIETIKSQLQINYGNLSHDSLKVTPKWQFNYNFSKPLKPLFDRNFIYIVDRSNLIIFDKKSFSISKKLKFDEEILSFKLLPGNLLCLFFAQKSICYLINDDVKVWQNNAQLTSQANKNALEEIKIYFDADMLLNRIFIAIPVKNSLKFLNVFNGKTVANYSSKSTIKAISEFDKQDNCIYVINTKWLECIKLK